jgi:hypothetical protein
LGTFKYFMIILGINSLFMLDLCWVWKNVSYKVDIRLKEEIPCHAFGFAAMIVGVSYLAFSFSLKLVRKKKYYFSMLVFLLFWSASITSSFACYNYGYNDKFVFEITYVVPWIIFIQMTCFSKFKFFFIYNSQIVYWMEKNEIENQTKEFKQRFLCKTIQYKFCSILSADYCIIYCEYLHCAVRV